MRIHLPPISLPLLLAAVITVAIACTTAEPTRTPEPTPTPVPAPTPTPTATPPPTPTPVPVLEPIVVDLDAEPAAFLAQLPEDELACVADIVGEVALQRVLAGEEPELSDEEGLAVLGCMSDETFARLFAGAIIADTGVELSATTVTCMVTRIVDTGLGELIGNLTVEEAGPEEFIPVILGVFPVLFCLNQDERVQLEEATAESGEGPFEQVSIGDLECFFDSLGPQGLASLGSVLSGGDDLPIELFSAIGECGLPLDAIDSLDALGGFGFFGASSAEGEAPPPEIRRERRSIETEPTKAPVDPPKEPLETPEVEMELPPELLPCLSQRLTPAELQELVMISGTDEVPSIGVIIAVFECGDSAIAAELGLETLPFDSEQLTCLLEALGEDRLAALMRGDVTPDFGMIGAVIGCGLDLSSLGSDG